MTAPRPDTVGSLLRGVSSELAREFSDVEVPQALLGRAHAVARSGRTPDLGPAPDKIAILAGPRALPSRDALHAAAAQLGAPVANTWGAKGIFAWDSPHHMGTCGLQARDFELLGFAGYDLIVATGIDELESPRARFELAPVLEIQPFELPRLRDWAPPRPFAERPNALYERIGAVAQPGYVDDSHPRHPARAVMDLKQSLAADSIVCGQPGPAGLWLARTFPTDRPGSVCVPAVAKPGIAAALALAASLQGRTTVAVTAAPVDEATRAIVDAAPEAFRLEVWGDDVDWTRTEQLIDAAGPVVAWQA